MLKKFQKLIQWEEIILRIASAGHSNANEILSRINNYLMAKKYNYANIWNYRSVHN